MNNKKSDLKTVAESFNINEVTSPDLIPIQNILTQALEIHGFDANPIPGGERGFTIKAKSKDGKAIFNINVLKGFI